MSRLPSLLGRCLSAVFGSWNIHWSAPPWLRWLGSWFGAHQRIAAGIMWLAILGGGFWIWSANRPEVTRPDLVTIAVKAPGLASVEKDEDDKPYLKPSPLRLSFSASSAPLEAVERPETEESQPGDAPMDSADTDSFQIEGVRLSPPVPGVWTWSTDQELRFDPEQDWEPDRDYQVLIEPRKLVLDTVSLASSSLEFSTAPFEVEVTKSDFYQNPKDPDIKQAVVQLTFSHGIVPEELKRRVQIQVVGDSVLFATSERLEEIRMADFDRQAFIRSRPITLPQEEDFVTVNVRPGVPVAQGTSRTSELLQPKIRVPDLYSYFQISRVLASTRRNENGEPEPYLSIQTKGLTRPSDFHPHVSLHLLPPFQEPETWPADEPKPTDWTLDTLTSEVLDQAEEVTLEPDSLIDASRPEDERRTLFNRFTYGFEHLSDDRRLLVRVAQNTPAAGGYKLKDEFRVIRPVPQGPRELHVLGRFGGILALTGDRKVTVKSRNLPHLKFRLGRVPTSQLNHLVSQTGGNFRTPSFRNYRFDETNFAHFSEEEQPVFLQNSFEANYNTLDLSPYLSELDPHDPDPARGLYFLRVLGWDPEKGERTKGGGHEGDQAFLLVTDLGIVSKRNEDGTRDVFVQSLATGSPVADAEVQILGKNGIPLVTTLTTTEGRASIPALDESRSDEKRPVALMVRLENDVSFMPLRRYEHHVSFSRFDTGGITAPTAGDLDGFLFTERGIYRPGDTLHAGVIIKPGDWEGRLEGIPIKVKVQDPRNRTLLEELITLTESGFAEFDCPTEYASPTGHYKLWAYLVHEEKDGKQPPDTLLATTSARVEEFLPDSMKVAAEVTPASGKGWVHPEALTATIDVQNLYGTPARERKVTGTVTAAPLRFSFDDFPDYIFFDRNLKNARFHSWNAGETRTDDEGIATLNFTLDAIAGATYSLRFEAQAFEPDSGRSVKAFANPVVVSPLSQAVGYRAEGELRYIPANTEKNIHLIAVNPQLDRIDLPGLRWEVKETYYVSILKEQRGGNFAYQSVEKERIVQTGEVSLLASRESSLTLPTDTPGEFTLTITDSEARELTKFGYSVMGKGNRSRSLDDNAELFVKLARPEWKRGEELELSITAPFTGTGLITIERDRVYSHKFFTTDTNSVVERIRIPDDLEGTAYVNVTFVRALDSPEIFMSPLSFAVAPFRIANDRRRLEVKLTPPEEARPGKPLRIPFQADRPCRIAIFAVDEGILQVTRYNVPQPLQHFQRKRALLVHTYQILDLLMPEYRHIQEQLPAFGGGADFQLNPFKRVTEAPVVFWSGILDAGPEERSVTYEVPDYFDGSLRVMAVAVARDGMGQADHHTTVVSPILIKPGVLTFAAPGDTFDLSVTLGNNLDPDAGSQDQVELAVETSEHVEILTPPPGSLAIARGREETLTFPVRARNTLGSATLTLRASAGEEASVRRATFSVRPPVPYTTVVQSGYTENRTLDVPVTRPLYPEFHDGQATASMLPLSLSRGLNEYLSRYPHGCTEQVVSGSFARILLSGETDFGLDAADIQAQIDRTCRLLRSRINESGQFGMWYSGSTSPIDFLTIYAAHYLTTARHHNFEVPASLLKSTLQALQKMAGLTEVEPAQFRDQAYAIYVLTLNDVVTTNYVLNLRDSLSQHFEDEEWMSGPTAVFLAGTYQLLQESEEAGKLLRGYRRAVLRQSRRDDDFHLPLAQDAQYLSILTQHFPEEAKKLSGAQLLELLDPLFQGEFNTLSAAYSVLALKGYSDLAAQFPFELSLSEVNDSGALELKAPGGLLKAAGFSREANAIRFVSQPAPGGPQGMFYQVSEGGFDRELPEQEIRDGLEIQREYLDAGGLPITEAKIGEPLTVRLRFRSLLRGQPITNVAIVDLLPGGFEPVRESIPAGRSKFPGIEFNEVREDRIVLFGTAPTQARVLEYQITPTRRGEFAIPPILVDSMYDRRVNARGRAGTIVVK